jgi:hypothetical protein
LSNSDFTSFDNLILFSFLATKYRFKNKEQTTPKKTDPEKIRNSAGMMPNINNLMILAQCIQH